MCIWCPLSGHGSGSGDGGGDDVTTLLEGMTCLGRYEGKYGLKDLVRLCYEFEALF